MSGEERQNKTCLACGDIMLSNQFTDSRKTWEQRKFCCQVCRVDFNAKRSPNRMPTHCPSVRPEALASAALLKRIVRYGLNHDGLPGMAANDLLALAAKLGVRP